MLAYLFIVDPYEDKIITMIEIANEAVVLSCTYFCWFFTDFVDDLGLRTNLGWTYSALLGAMVVLNLTYMLYVGIF